MIFQSAYETSACPGYIVKQIQEALQEFIIQNVFKKDDSGRIYIVESGYLSLSDEKVPSFYHPMIVEHRGEKNIVVDVRQTGKYNVQSGNFEVRDKDGYDAIVLRGELNDVFVNGLPEQLKNVSQLPLDVYMNWVSESIAKRIGLDGRDQFVTSVLAGVLYLNLFWNKQVAEKTDITYLTTTISRVSGMPHQAVYEIVQAYPIIKNLEEFCTALKEVTQSVRFNNFNVSLLIQIIGGYWYGVNAREIIAVALEHPPTWMALIFQAINDKGMRHSGLTKILDRNRFKKNWESFNRALLNIARS